MKILYLHRTQAKGVEGVHIGEIVKAWQKMGHPVEILSPVGAQLGDTPVAGAPRKPGFKQKLFKFISSRLPEFFFELAELAYNLIALNQARKLGRANVDFIFERYAIFALAGAFLSRRWEVPFVIEINYTSRSHLVRERSALLKPLAHRLDKYIFARATGLVAVSTRLKEHLMTDYGIEAERIIVLPNAADPDVFDPSKVAPPVAHVGLQGKIIGFVGGFYPWHGLDLLLQAFKLMADRVPDAKLMLIGDGPMLPVIREQSEKEGMADRVILTGRIGHNDLPGYVTLFHVGVMPDSNDYGSPMKIFEYMALAKPVVVPDYGPLLDAVEDGREGRIFKARDVGGMADCLAALLSDDALYRRMSEQAREKILTKHNWMNNGKAILAMLPGRTR
ncbi:MAG: glycosyltransferase family 4 protein [Betaproteobacteria bacterium]|nr:glycosyltransferase family 4 protein [Betaproteobacteria bacterium]